MSRRFLRPFFEFWEPNGLVPFFPKKAIPGGKKGKKQYQGEVRRTVDANETFDNFFHDYYSTSNALKKEQKEFFEKYYPERVGKKFNPYEVLQLEKNADLEKIKQAYRTNAIKYHPKVDSSSEAQRKFNDIARAYHQLVHERKTDDNGQDVSTKSLFEDFHNQMEEFQKDQAVEDKSKLQSSGTKAQPQQKKSNLNIKPQQSKQQPKSSQKPQSQSQSQPSSQPQQKPPQKQSQKSTNSFLKGAELYSESSYYEFINGQRKLHVTKKYERDGRKLKVDRIEGQLPDGSIQVTQILDDGKEVKNRKYIQSPSKKQKRIQE